jgi:hypothetical protein
VANYGHHKLAITGVAVTSDWKHIVSASKDGTVRVLGYDKPMEEAALRKISVGSVELDQLVEMDQLAQRASAPLLSSQPMVSVVKAVIEKRGQQDDASCSAMCCLVTCSLVLLLLLVAILLD